MAKSLMVQGTGSGAGKSLLVVALCRIFRDMGIRVAPFKSQNMALNSYITIDGGEIGRAQALQAEAAGIEPSTDINPILLKASGEMGSQVIIQGRVVKTMKASEYYEYRSHAWESVKESYGRLQEDYELIVIEGAGSPAEINLMEVDIANMAVAKLAEAPVVLVGDIDRGGVFASLYGTVSLVGKDREYIKGYLINKFRGDPDILSPGLDMLADQTGIPVLGVIPYMKEIGLPEEDGMSVGLRKEHGSFKSGFNAVRMVVLRLPYISNFTDFDPFTFEPDVEVLYSLNPADIENADILVIPGSKNTVDDLLFLKRTGLDESIKRACRRGVDVIGICGGYQILSKRILDPYAVESPHSEVEGLGLLDVETSFESEKITSQVSAGIVKREDFFCYSGGGGEEDMGALWGYEIHMGTSSGDTGLFRVSRIRRDRDGVHRTDSVIDGSKKDNCWGTYLHGLFENDRFRREVINHARAGQGLEPLSILTRYGEIRSARIQEVSDMIKENIDIKQIMGIIGI